jgi:hypothetical protein
VKIGDLVKMHEPYYDDIDMWGIGVVVKVEKSRHYPHLGFVAVVYWSEQAGLSWDEDFELKVISESR